MAEIVQYPKVSVFLPVYNQEKFVEDAIESVLAQDYPNLEIVIGDDGSTDSTVFIVKKYKEKFPNLFKLILSETNTGITANCNRILKECTGEYIALFAGDDVWLPNKLHTQIACLQQNEDAALCFTRVEVFDSDSDKTIYFSPAEDIFSQVDDIVSFSAALGDAGCSFMIPGWAIPEHGFDSRTPSVSDWLFWIDVLRKGRACYINEVFGRYRRHKNNTSNNFNLILSEHLMTLCLMEKKYPDLQREIGNFRRKTINKLLMHNYIYSGDKIFKEKTLPLILHKFEIDFLVKILFDDFLRRIKKKLSVAWPCGKL